MVKIAPSVLAADVTQLGREVSAVAAADWLHVDVMDGHFVPNISMGPAVVTALRRCSSLFLDVHLMIEDPDRYLEAFAEAGADQITVHVEACRHLHRTLSAVRALGKRAGVALNPATSPDSIEHVLHLVDLVLVMTVNPGFGGQTFLSETLAKLPRIQGMTEARRLEGVELQVDGGIDATTAASAVSSGATVLVAGTAIFGSEDPAAALQRLHELANS